MKIRDLRRVTFLAALLSTAAMSSTVSRVTNFTDGSVLFASDLNSEFNNLVDGVNNINNDNIISGANISPAKLSSSIAGDGLSRDGSTGVLSVNVDGVTLDTSSNTVLVKSGGISATQLASNAVTTAKILDANVTAAKLSSNSVTTAKIEDGAVTFAKLATSINYSIATISAPYVSSPASRTDVPGLSISLTTHGRPVIIQLLGTSVGCGTNSDVSAICTLYLMRDSTDLDSFEFGSIIGNNGGILVRPTSFFTPSPSVNTFDVVAAGTYTYKLQAIRGLPSSIITIPSTVRIVAREL